MQLSQLSNHVVAAGQGRHTITRDRLPVSSPAVPAVRQAQGEGVRSRSPARHYLDLLALIARRLQDEDIGAEVVKILPETHSIGWKMRGGPAEEAIGKVLWRQRLTDSVRDSTAPLRFSVGGEEVLAKALTERVSLGRGRKHRTLRLEERVKQTATVTHDGKHLSRFIMRVRTALKPVRGDGVWC